MKVLREIVWSILMVLFLTSAATYAQSRAKESFDKGMEYAIQGEFEKAKEEFKKALEADKFFKPAAAGLKTIMDVIEQKIKRKTAIHIFEGASYSNKGQYDQAIKDYSKAIEIDPGSALAYDNRGFAYLVKLGDKVKGCADWKKACELGRCENYNLAKQKGECR